jgi:hypothetical protein
MDYIMAFDLAAVCRYPDDRIAVARNPAGTEAAWWCEAAKAGPVIREATLRRHPGSCLRARRNAHRACHGPGARQGRSPGSRPASLGREETGVLHQLNQEYRRRRLEAQRRGERFMGYAQATARLRRAMMKVAAIGTAPVAIVGEVFESGGKGCP